MRFVQLLRPSSLTLLLLALPLMVPFATAAPGDGAGMNPGCTAVPSGLVGWWAGDASGTNFTGANHGTLQGTTFGPGEVGQAFSFDGSGAYVDCGTSAILHPPGAFTVMAWIYRASSAASLAVVLKKTGREFGQSDGYSLEFGGGNNLAFWAFTEEGGWTASPPLAVPLRTWTHVAGVCDGQSVRVFVNGFPSTGTLLSGPVIGSSHPLHIGHDPINTGTSAYWFEGLIDEAAIFNRALSSNEVSAIYAAGGAGMCKNALPPTILVSPTNQFVAVGSNLVMTVTASGTSVLSYQWSVNGSNVPGAISSTFLLSQASTNQTGSYSVTVSNAYGTATSLPAIVTVVPPPVIAVQPQSQSWPLGYPVTLTVAASTVGPSTFQWLMNGTNLPDATNISYFIPSLQANHVGTYAVRISNLAGVIQSSTLTLASREAIFRNPENFELGWGDWLRSGTVWELGTPTNGPGRAHSGSNCAAIVLDGVYPDNVDSSLISPWTVVPAADQNPRLRFWHWYSIDPNGPCFQRSDYGQVYVVRTNGVWEEISPEYYWTSDWTRASLDLSAYAGERVQFAFYFYANCAYADSGWFIDEVEVVTGSYTLAALEGFEGGMGDWTPDRGNWQVGTPTNGPGRAHSGNNCAAIVLDGMYPDNVSSSLISPWTVVPAANLNPRLRFWHWYSIYPGGACFQGSDMGQVYVVRTNGVWEQISPDYYWGSDWTRASLDLSGYAGQRVQFAFYFYANCAYADSGWFIDEVEVVTGSYTMAALEGFEGGMGNWAPDRGNWRVGTPTNGPGRAHSGNNCAAIVLDGVYPDNVDSSLISPWTVVPAANQNPRLRFWHWYSIDPNGPCFQRSDYGQVYVVRTNGVWEEISPEYYWTSDWTRASLDLSAYAGERVQFAFYFYANCAYADSGWFIDEVEVVTGSYTLAALEGFEGGMGDWTPDRGNWQVGTPTNGPGRAHSGNNCAAIVLDGLYPNNVASSLISPWTVVPSANLNPRLRFWHWYSIYPGGACFQGSDMGQVYVVRTNGVWEQISPDYYWGSDWTRASLDLSGYAGQRVQFAFYFYANCAYADSGWFIDEVEVVTGSYTMAALEGFEGGMGNWAPDRGNWRVGTPTNGPGRAHSGSNCAAIVLDGVYPDNVDSSLISPWTVVPAADQNPRLRFWHWYSIDPNGPCFQRSDYGQVYVVRTNGVWEEISPEYYWTSDWTRASLDLSAYAGERVQFAFYFYANCAYADSGWFIDEVEVVTGSYTLAALEGFEGGMGDWTPDRGNWQVGTPTNGPGRAHSGSNCAAIVLDGLYPNNVASSLISPWTVVPSANLNPRLRFWHWYSIYPGGACFQGSDMGQVYVVRTNGVWEQISPDYYWGSDWTRASLDLSGYAGQRVQFAFYFYANCAYADSGWFIDEVEVVTGSYTMAALEGFEGGMGNWAPDRGNWRVGTPTNGPGRAHSGSNCAAIVLDGVYPDNVDSSLISPWTVVPAADQNPRLRFWHWYSIDPNGPCFQRSDYGQVYVVRTNGVWEEISPEYYWTSDWTRASLDLSAYAGERVQFAFYFYANCAYADSGWFIDEVEVVTGSYTLAALEGFEGGMGDWTPDRGNWQVGTPTNGPGRAHSGNNCAAIVLDGMYPDNVSSSLISPWTVVPAANLNPRLRFWHWYSIYPGGACFQGSDMGQVYVVRTNGVWEQISPDYYWGSDWTRASLDLSGYAGQRVQFAFYFYANCAYADSGWFIDEVEVVTGSYTMAALEGFEGGMGNWAPDRGNWRVGTPTNGPGRAHSGNNCAAIVLDGVYPDNVDSSLISPWTVVPAANQNPRLRFWHWYSIDPNGPCFQRSDYGQVYVVRTNGVWEPISPEYYWSSDWTRASLDLSAYAGQRVQFAFYFYANCAYPDSGWFIDEVSLYVPGPLPDLQVGFLVAPTNAFAGTPVEFSWTTINQGNTNARAHWVDTISLSTSPTGANPVPLALVTNFTDLAPTQSVVRTATVVLPGIAAGIRYLVVQTDSADQVFEDEFETNNITVLAQPIYISTPDLLVRSVTNPTNARFGQNIPVSWAVTNAGTGSPAARWIDGIFLSSTTGVGLSAYPLGSYLAPRADSKSYISVANVTLPLSASVPPGDYYIVVVTDAGRTQEESNENNNTNAGPRITIAYPPLADLAVTNVIAPSNALAGRCVEISWGITNRGPTNVSGIWNETVYLGTNAVLSNATALAVFTVTNQLTAGGFVTRTQSVCLPPDGPAGRVWLMVEVDSARSVLEQDDANNLGTTTNLVVPLGLTLQIPGSDVMERGPGSTLQATVYRNGPRTNALTITLASSDTNELSVPPSVTITSNQASATFTLVGVQDNTVDGAKLVNVRATAPVFSNATAVVTVLDVDVPHLFVDVATNVVRERGSFQAAVTREFYTIGPLTVHLAAENPGELIVPPQVTIADGQTTAFFTVSCPPNDLVQGDRRAAFYAEVSGYLNGSNSVVILDDDVPTLTLGLLNNLVSEGAGSQATWATVTRVPAGRLPLVVQLESSDLTEARVPHSITIPAGQTSAQFPVSAIDDLLPDGTNVVVLTATATETLTGRQIEPGVTATLLVTDDDAPALRVRLGAEVISEGLSPATTGTVTRLHGTVGTLTVTLTSSDQTEATVPATVTIPNGQATATFAVRSINDGEKDGSQTVNITASAPGLASGTASVVVTDDPLPDLAFIGLTVSANAEAGNQISVCYTVTNQGFAVASQEFRQHVYFSTDAYPDEDELVAEASFRGPLPANSRFEQCVPVRLPQAAGDYQIIVVLDADNAVMEIVEHNNRRVAPIHVEATYTAQVQTDVTVAPAGTKVPLRGSAAVVGSGASAPGKLVHVHVRVRGTDRVLETTTDDAGNFTDLLFEPLANEAGVYEIFATHPGVSDGPAQDTFTLLGLGTEPASASVVVPGLESVSNTVQLVNLGNAAVEGLIVTAEHNAAAIEVDLLSVPTRVAPSSNAPLAFAIRSKVDQALSATVRLRVTNPVGVSVEVPVAVRVEPRRPRLVAEPSSIEAGALLSQNSYARFVLRNDGSRDSGPLQIVSPIGWATPMPASLTNLAAGSSANISLRLRPVGSTNLGAHSGRLAINGADTGLQVPFTFRVVSEDLGALQLEAVDEYTYWAEGAPRLAGAGVSVRDLVRNLDVFTGAAGDDGFLFLPRLRESYYRVEVTADKHTPFAATVYVAPDTTNNVLAFLSRQTVQYRFTVEPATVDDRTRIRLETVFEAFVPIPVVTVEPAYFDLLDFTNDTAQVDLKVSNHGLVAADNVRLQFGRHRRWTITPLVGELGPLGANSSITVPVTVAKGGDPNAPDDCQIFGSASWTLSCGPVVNTYAAPIYFANARDCSGSPVIVPPYRGSPGMPGPVVRPGSPPPIQGADPQFEPGSPVYFPPVVWEVTPRCNQCSVARVGVRIDQEAVIARDAFNAVLDLVNASGGVLADVRVDLEIRDQNGQLANNRFVIRPPTLRDLTAVDGTGVIFPSATGRAAWQIIPTSEAAPNGPTPYFVGGTFSYREGTNVVRGRPLEPAPITVLPNASLHIDYFHQRDVFSDDPFTAVIEPSVPFSLGVMVRNEGPGVARNVRLTSAQPEIIENQRGLLIDFDIIGTQVGRQTLTPSLTANFGDIGPGQLTVGRWLLTSTLQGLFVNYTASFEHLDGLGDPRLSLIDSVNIHEMIHVVRAGGGFEDGLPDFLVNDTEDANDLPDRLYSSDGQTAPVESLLRATVTGTATSTGLVAQLSATLPSGWFYLRVGDPGNGRYRLNRVLRSDGVELARDNFWLTDRTFVGGGQAPVRTNLLHLFDLGGAYSYTLVYSATNDVTPPASRVHPLPDESYEAIPLVWSGEDDAEGTGVGFYDIFVSVDGRAFVAWQTETRQNGAIYPGELGHRYAFYSVGTDRAGNREPAPGSPDAMTRVTLTNRAPVVVAIADCQTFEGAVLTQLIQAGDPDGGQVLGYRLVAGPAGATLDGTTGLLRWATGEGHGDGTYRFEIQVCDNGHPRLCDSVGFTCFIRDSNSPPVLAPVPVIALNVGQALVLTNRAFDQDIPKQALTFFLDTNSVPTPPTARLTNSAPGLGEAILRWAPSQDYASSTQRLRVVVCDNGTPSLCATQDVVVVVNDFLALGLGQAVLRTNQSGSVPLTVFSSAGVRRLCFSLEVTNVGYLADVNLAKFGPRICAITVTEQSPTHWRFCLDACAGERLLGTEEIARLNFTTLSNRSAFVLLNVQEVEAERADGTPIPRVAARPGRVVVIGREPLLELTKGVGREVWLTLYGNPGASYRVLWTDELGVVPQATGWQPLLNLGLTGLWEAIRLEDATDPATFYRAYQLDGP